MNSVHGNIQDLMARLSQNGLTVLRIFTETHVAVVWYRIGSVHYVTDVLLTDGSFVDNRKLDYGDLAEVSFIERVGMRL